MGISRDSRHKRRLTGGRMPIHQKKRAFEKARPVSNTKLGVKRDVRPVRVRGGGHKYRAMTLDTGNFVWISEQVTRKVKIIDVVYNATNNELIRTKTLVKNAIVQVDANPFKAYLLNHYKGVKDAETQIKGKLELNFEAGLPKEELAKKTEALKGKMKTGDRKYLKRRLHHQIETNVQNQFTRGVVLACITSRPGQNGRADGYILEGKELEFYLKKIERK